MTQGWGGRWRAGRALAAGFLCLLGASACAHTNVTPVHQPSAPDAQTLFRKGVAHLRSGDLLRAEQYLSLSVREGYPEARVLPLLLDLCLSASRYRAALGHAEPYLDRHPDDRRLRALVAAIRGALLGTRTAPPESEAQPQPGGPTS